jgi:hypothetical protein
VNKTKLLKGAGLVALTAMLPLSQAAADGNWGISGWINEGVTYYDDGVGSDIVQVPDNGTTLGSRITLSGSTDLPNSGLNAGFEVILEPRSADASNLLGLGSSGQFNGDSNGEQIGVLGSSINVGGSFGKLTVGLQSMPTDNIAVLEDPSLTLWASISPVFRGNGSTIRGLGAGATNATWGSFLQCLGTPGLGIGIDCNGVYRNGVRYDLPAFGPVTVAVGYANDDIYDVAAKYKGALGGINTSLALGYSVNNGGAGAGGTDAETFQMQAGAMDPGTGIFGSIAYQNESANGAAVNTGDDTDAYWLKVGIKKAFNSFGDTSFAFQYGSYNDQFGTGATAASSATAINATSGIATTTATAAVVNPGITGSEVERIGFEVNQYFGSRLILYGVWEQLDLNVDCSNAACATAYGGAQELDMFTTGLTFFF